MIGKEDWSGGRKRPFRYYMCSRKNREGWTSCPSGKIPADRPEQAILMFVTENLLTAEFATAQMAELEERLFRRKVLREDRVEETRRRLDGVAKSTGILLDLAEQYGAASAGARLVEREAERRELQAKLEQMEARQETQRQAEPPDAVQAMLAEMQETLAGTDTKAKQVLLKKRVVRVKLGKAPRSWCGTQPSSRKRLLPCWRGFFCRGRAIRLPKLPRGSVSWLGKKRS